jgi:LPS export ABC transporter protein LptC
MAAFQIRKIQSIIVFIIVLVAVLWLFQDNIMEISLFQKNTQQSDNIKEEINEAAYLEKIGNFVLKEYSNEQLLLHILEAETYSRKKNKPVELLNVKVTTYDEFGQEGVVLSSNRAEILESGEIFFNGKVSIQSKNGVSHEINTESLIVFSNRGQIKSNRKVTYLGENAKIDAQGMEMNIEDDTMSLIGKTIINQDSGSVIETTNLFVVHAD